MYVCMYESVKICLTHATQCARITSTIIDGESKKQKSPKTNQETATKLNFGLLMHTKICQSLHTYIYTPSHN